MKVKNIMFSGFAAAILMGVAAEASAAPVAVASKGYVDSVAGKLVDLEGAANEARNLVEAINVKLDPVSNLASELTPGEYYTSVKQTSDGQVAVSKANLAIEIEGGVMKAPTTDAVHQAIQGVSGQTNNLDLTAVGGDGKYVKLVSQADGQVSAEEGTIDTELSRTSVNPVTNAAITNELAYKQDLLDLGTNLSYGTDGKLNAKDTTYTADGYVNISGDNVITVSGLQPTITDGTDVATTTGFISEVKQDNGTVTAAATAFDEVVDPSTSEHTYTAPTTKAVYTAIEAVSNQTERLDLNAVGGDGKFVKLVSQANGQVSATATDFDTNVSAAGTDNTAPTTKAVHDAIEGVRADIPNMPEACNERDVTCVLTSEGGIFAWAILTKPVTADDESLMAGTDAQDQDLSASVPTVQNP